MAEKRGTKAFLAGLLLGILVGLPAIFMATRVSRPLAGQISIKLVARCQIDILDTTLQPVNTILLNCPRVDSIRLWPLPVQMRWMEKPIAPEGGNSAKSGMELTQFQRDISSHNLPEFALNRLIFKPEGML